jgi:hypothetical protein
MGVSSMDAYSLPSSFLPPHFLIAPLGVDCKFAVLYNKTKFVVTKGHPRYCVLVSGSQVKVKLQVVYLNV